MAIARDHLRADDLTLPRIAHTVGYDSPFAFAAAFRRHHGDSETWRQTERTAAQTRRPTTHHGSWATPRPGPSVSVRTPAGLRTS
ncbi:hypothetical protein [Streptomyces sp. NPDC057690]|uniref:hypothetical protein n=1 Tax=Streptomyces sp. NPDC057690 TaxID=3346214 RepID=UPI0036BEC90A